MIKNTTPIMTVDDAIYDLIHYSDLPAKAQAEALGVSYSRLVNSCIESSETAYHHTRWILPQTLMARNFVLMDFLERALGRVAVPVVFLGSAPCSEADRLLDDVMAVAEEMGEMAGAIREAFQDSQLSRDKAERCKKETWDLIVQAVKVYQDLDALAGSSTR